MKTLAWIAVLLLAASCAARTPAPVAERMQLPEPAQEAAAPAEPPTPEPKPLPTHTVKKGDTMVSIALQYGLDYRELAAWNNITNVNALKLGQVLVLAPPPGSAPPPPPVATGPVATPLASAGPPIEGRPLSNSATTKVEPRAQKLPFSERALAQLSAGDAPLPEDASAATPTPPALPPATEPPRAAGTDKEDIDWMWPVKGKLLAPFSETTKGVDLGGRKGVPVLAASAGRVIYADEGLRGYGKLVIIRHNDTWLSAYAHNDKLVVKEQDEVKKGQKIAEMGSSGTDQVKLHFEVRRQGKPVDPAKVLPPL